MTFQSFTHRNLEGVDVSGREADAQRPSSNQSDVPLKEITSIEFQRANAATPADGLYPFERTPRDVQWNPKQRRGAHSDAARVCVPARVKKDGDDHVGTQDESYEERKENR